MDRVVRSLCVSVVQVKHWGSKTTRQAVQGWGLRFRVVSCVQAWCLRALAGHTVMQQVV